ncbi:MAG: transcriptional repressor [Cytophagales bacterium]|nr:MAG: transcriptional repressor [Cytophagales bacterium]
MNGVAESLLNTHQVRKTKIRLEVLDFFLSKNYALSHAEIEEAIDKSYDRVTIYRTLKSFEEQGLIHKVLDDSGTSKYALCASNCMSHKHNDAHVHFNCEACGHTFCLEDIPIPAISLPTNYQLIGYSFLVQGVCKDCKK